MKLYKEPARRATVQINMVVSRHEWPQNEGVMCEMARNLAVREFSLSLPYEVVGWQINPERYYSDTVGKLDHLITFFLAPTA